MHVPFCRAHCPYCDFTVAVLRRVPHDQYLDAILAELRSRAHELGGVPPRTLYFGGGTPALWAPSALGAVVEAVRALAATRPLDEVTVEVNPGEATPDTYAALRDAGVDRVSLGIQSFDAPTLALLGRQHRPDDGRRAVRDALEAGIGRVSVDIIFGTAGAPTDAAVHDARIAVGLGAQHVSAYALTIEPRTAFGARASRGASPAEPPDDRDVLGSAVADALRDCGLARYEVSSFARSGHEAIHNAGYWRGDIYLGLGTGAHSLVFDHRGPVRRANGRNLRRYLDGHADADRTDEPLNARTHLAELVMLGVRTTAGIDLCDVATRWGEAAAAEVGTLAGRWHRQGWCIVSSSRVVPTDVGIDIADTLGIEALAALT